ncbi:hypothetical protein FW774_00120 (plasmid) [Pedobacter sp. BS3]|nr:hypothetical protein FW774_00120 [Pedobacter sp. BS3]
MKTVKRLVVIAVAFISFLVLPAHRAQSQCAMCTLNAENSVQNGNTDGKGLNDGILFLLAAPYVAVAVVGFVWYKKYRRKNINVDIKDQKIHLN